MMSVFCYLTLNYAFFSCIILVLAAFEVSRYCMIRVHSCFMTLTLTKSICLCRQNYGTRVLKRLLLNPTMQTLEEKKISDDWIITDHDKDVLATSLPSHLSNVKEEDVSKLFRCVVLEGRTSSSPFVAVCEYPQ